MICSHTVRHIVCGKEEVVACGRQVWLSEDAFCGCGKWWKIVEVTSCVVIWRVAKWAWLSVVSESAAGCPSVQPWFDDCRCDAWFAGGCNELQIVDGVVYCWL